MADSTDKNENNVEGQFYVDNTCIGCEVCVQTAPDFYDIEDDMAYVYNQPEDEEGEALCREAMDGCPVDAIGDDG